MVKITGRERVKKRLDSLTSEAMIRDVGKALQAGGEIIEKEAELSITTGGAFGKGHVVSMPGQPPNQDTGVLDGNIETVLVEPLKVEVSSNAPYASELEFGTSKMTERPYLRPAVAKKRKEVVDLVAKAVRQTVAKHSP